MWNHTGLCVAPSISFARDLSYSQHGYCATPFQIAMTRATEIEPFARAVISRVAKTWAAVHWLHRPLQRSAKVLNSERQMITKTTKQLLSVLACSTLIMAGTSAEAMDPQQDQASSQQNSTQPPSSGVPSTSSAAPAVALQSPDQLDALVAPIALYPDALVAQVLAAPGHPGHLRRLGNHDFYGGAGRGRLSKRPWYRHNRDGRLLQRL